MNITVNGKKVELDNSVSISDYLGSIGINPNLVVVEHNYQIPDKKNWASIFLKDGDNLEIVKFIGGG